MQLVRYNYLKVEDKSKITEERYEGYNIGKEMEEYVRRTRYNG